MLVFEGVTAGGIGRHVGATVGYQTKGHCGKPYDQLSGSGLCPWAVNVDVNYNSSIFNSRFLESEYRDFLDQIGRVPALAASVKAALGPYALVAEWNGATRRARFVDDAGRAVGIQPAAWQVSIGRQFDWNPWVEEIGAQGTFVSVSYSQSRDLAGVTRLLDATPLSYRDIHDATGVSTTTIVRIARFLRGEANQGYRLALDAIGGRDAG